MSNKKQPTIPVAVFDMSSASVGGAHAYVRYKDFSHTEKVFLVSQERQTLNLHEDINTERFISETVSALEKVASSLYAKDMQRPEYVQIVLASPWYTSQTRVITYSKSTYFTCTEQFVEGLVSKEIDHILLHEKGRFEGIGTDYVIVEKQISLIKLNGYVVNNPYGKKAQSIEISLTITIAPKIILEKFKEAIGRVYAIKKIGVTTSVYTTFIAMRENAAISQSCVAVDVGEEVTDIAFIRDGVFLYQHSFPVGAFELPRLVAQHGGYELSEVPALLDAYRVDKLAPKNKKKIETAIAVFCSTWQKEVQKVIDAGYYGFTVPLFWYVVVDPKYEVLLKQTLENDPYIKHNSVGLPMVDIVTEDELYSIQKTIDTELDIPIALALLFVEKIL